MEDNNEQKQPIGNSNVKRILANIILLSDICPDDNSVSNGGIRIKLAELDDNMKFKRKWKRIGRCQPNKCGSFCCRIGPVFHNITTLDYKGYNLYKMFGWITFKLGKKEFAVPNQSCNKLINGRCSIYKKRPRVCRNFPEDPSLNWYKIARKNGCTYKFIKVKI